MSARLVIAGVAFTMCAAVVAGAQGGTQPPERGDDPAGAMRYFLQVRANPDGRIPSGARRAALDQMRARWPLTPSRRSANRLMIPLTPSGLSTTWVPLGPAPTQGTFGAASGRLNTIAVDPGNGQHILVGGAQGGVWTTTDGGATWAPLSDDQCSLAMGSIAFDPNNTSVIYAGTGELNNSGDSYYGCGVLKSIDGGASWTQVGAGVFYKANNSSARISRVLVDRTASATVLAATSLGLFRSPDAGATWQSVGPAAVASDVVQDPTTGAVFYAAFGNAFGGTANGVYRSADNGATWTKLAGGLPTANVGRINLAISGQPQTTVYAAVQDAIDGTGADGALLALMVSFDGGTTWAARSKTAGTAAMCGSGQQCWYDMYVAADPTNASRVYFGGFSVYRSDDGGTTFADIAQGIHVDQHAFAFDPTTPTTIYAGNDGGIWKSTNGTASSVTWTSLNTNLSITQFYAGLSVSPIDQNVLMGGTQDNGTLQSNGTTTWPLVLGGDGGFTSIDQVTGGAAFAETQWTPNSGFNGPWRRDAGGSQFVQKTSGISLSDPAAFIPPMVEDPFRPRMLYFGTINLYRSANFGEVWSNIGTNLVATTSGTLLAIGVAPSDSLTLYAGSSDGRLSYTHTAGPTWTTATVAIGTRAITDFAVDARNARHAVMANGGFGVGHVWQTTDGGVNWTDISFDLPDIPALSVVMEPGSNDIDVGTDIGVFTLRAGSTTWQPIVDGLPNAAVYDLVFDTQRSRLIAATHGRGVFALDVTPPAVLRGDVDGDGDVDAADAQAILQSIVGLPVAPGGIRYPNGDANCDGQVTAVDALLVLMKAAGMNTAGSCVGTNK